MSSPNELGDRTTHGVANGDEPIDAECRGNVDNIVGAVF
jgi:hypothetical protein